MYTLWYFIGKSTRIFPDKLRYRRILIHDVIRFKVDQADSALASGASFKLTPRNKLEHCVTTALALFEYHRSPWRREVKRKRKTSNSVPELWTNLHGFQVRPRRKSLTVPINSFLAGARTSTTHTTPGFKPV